MATPKLLSPALVFYHWGRDFLRRVEMFTAADKEDLAKLPEIPLDTASKPALPLSYGRRRRWMEITDRADRRNRNDTKKRF